MIILEHILVSTYRPISTFGPSHINKIVMKFRIIRIHQNISLCDEYNFVIGLLYNLHVDLKKSLSRMIHKKKLQRGILCDVIVSSCNATIQLLHRRIFL
jgi:hypothetical protein